MTCSKNPSPECFGFIVETHTKLHTEKLLFSKVPWNYFLIYLYILYFCIAALGAESM